MILKIRFEKLVLLYINIPPLKYNQDISYTQLSALLLYIMFGLIANMNIFQPKNPDVVQ